MAASVPGASDTILDAIDVRDLSFAPMYGAPNVLRNITFTLPKGARCVLVGLNGAGKSTMLEVIAGRKMAPKDHVFVLGSDPFRGASGSKVALVQGGWRNSSLQDERAQMLQVRELLHLPEDLSTLTQRQRQLHEGLHLSSLYDRQYGTLSDGERRKVELGRMLADPHEVILLDEATADLDLVSRKAALAYLYSESVGMDDAAPCTVINATHVFDSLEGWATHILHLHEGAVVRCSVAPQAPHAPLWQDEGSLFQLVANWLRTHAELNLAAPAPLPRSSSPTCKSAIEVRNLRFAYEHSGRVALQVDELDLPPGCRCVLVGANGAGKSSLLSILAGRRLIQDGDVRCLGLRAFHDHRALDSEVTILSSEWKRQVADISGGKAMSFRELSATTLQEVSEGGRDMAVLASRMVKLVQMLAIDPNKPIGAHSDGGLRRIQLALKLIRPCRVLLVDEVTADLDVLAREALLSFLKDESQAGTAVVYCTHIMDGLDGWATHVLNVRRTAPSATLPAEALTGSMFDTVHHMLMEDAAHATASQTQTSERKIQPEHGEAELPYGWTARLQALDGAFGNYAWKKETGAEEDWSFGSVAPNPDQQRPPQPQPSPFGTQPQQQVPGQQVPGQLGFGPPQRTEAAPRFDAPMAPQPCAGGVAAGTGTAAGNQGATAKPLVADSCPDSFKSRDNQVPLQELIRKGAVLPERTPTS